MRMYVTVYRLKNLFSHLRTYKLSTEPTSIAQLADIQVTLIQVNSIYNISALLSVCFRT